MERVSPQIYEAYASTDCGQITIIKPEDRAEHGDSVGQPIWAVVLKIVDDHEREVPFATAGGNLCANPDGN